MNYSRELVMRWWIFDEWLDELKIFVKNKNSLLKIEFSKKFKKKKNRKILKKIQLREQSERYALLLKDNCI